MAVTTPAAAPADAQTDTGTGAAEQPRSVGLFASALAPVDPARPEPARANGSGEEAGSGASSASFHGSDGSSPAAGAGDQPRAKQGIVRAWLLAGAARWAKGGGTANKRLDVKKAKAQAIKEARQVRESINRTSAPLSSSGVGAGGKAAGAANKGAGKGSTKAAPKGAAKAPQKSIGSAHNSPAGRGSSGSGAGGGRGPAGGAGGRKGASGGATRGGSGGAMGKDRGGARRDATGPAAKGATGASRGKPNSPQKTGATTKPGAPGGGAKGSGASKAPAPSPGAKDNRRSGASPTPKRAPVSLDKKTPSKDRPGGPGAKGVPTGGGKGANVGRPGAASGGGPAAAGRGKAPAPAPAPKGVGRGGAAPAGKQERPRVSLDKKPSPPKSAPVTKPGPGAKAAPAGGASKGAAGAGRGPGKAPAPGPHSKGAAGASKDTPRYKPTLGGSNGRAGVNAKPSTGSTGKGSAPASGLGRKDSPRTKDFPGGRSTPKDGLGAKAKGALTRRAKNTAGLNDRRAVAKDVPGAGRGPSHKEIKKDRPWKERAGTKGPGSKNVPEQKGSPGKNAPGGDPRHDPNSPKGATSSGRRTFSTRKSREAGYRDGARAGKVIAHGRAYRDGARDGYTDVTQAAYREKVRLDKAHEARKKAREKEEPVNGTATSADYHQTQATPVQVKHVDATHVQLGDGAARQHMSRGEVRSLKQYERRLGDKEQRMQQVAETTKGLKAHAEQQAQKVTTLMEGAKAVKGGEKLAASLARLQEAAQVQSGKAEEIHTRAVRAADGCKAVLHNVEARYGGIYKAVVDSDETAPAELRFYRDGGTDV